MAFKYENAVISCVVMLVAGCSSGAPESTGGSNGLPNEQTIAETVVRQNDDGTVSVATYRISVAEAAAEVESRKQLALSAGKVKVESFQATTQGANGNCTGGSLWLNEGPNQTGNRICFFKNPNAAGTSNMDDYWFADWAVVGTNTQSWWAGSDPGGFFKINGGPGATFSQYEQCNACGIVNWPFLGFS